jgi:threonine dehydratase
MPYSYSLVRRFVSRMVSVSDAELKKAMALLFWQMHIAVEPACAAATAALKGPLSESLAGKRVVLVFCGSNIDWPSYARHVEW